VSRLKLEIAAASCRKQIGLVGAVGIEPTNYSGLPVSTGLTMLKIGIAWIGWVATRPEARGHGYGRLATIAAVRPGFKLGGTLASLEATSMGVPIYLRLGFREILRYRNYWPSTV
jgi:hypothetical protein